MKVTQKEAREVASRLGSGENIEQAMLMMDLLATGKGKYIILENKQTVSDTLPRELVMLHDAQEVLTEHGYAVSCSLSVSRGRLVASYELTSIPHTNGQEG